MSIILHNNKVVVTSDNKLLTVEAGNIERVTWNQCPTLVKSYLDNVTYDTDYTYTYVTEYAPSPTVSSNTKPIGKTVDGVTYHNNIPNADTPFSSANVAGTIKPLDRLRWINSRTSNMRDLGGWSCDGGTIKYGLIYRSGALNAQDENLVINELGIRQEIDLRGSDEATESVYGDKIRYLSYNGADVMYTLAPKDTWRAYLRALFDSVIVGDPVVFHCASGADRTGSFACIIEALLGVSQSDCDKDYELTSFYTIRTRDKDYQGGGGADWRRLITQITALSGNTFRDKVINFVASLGFTAEEINAFRAAMIDGTPETVTPSVGTITITNTLTNATSDNSATSLTKYQPYKAIITPNEGYKIDESTVNVTMGGNITNASAVVKTLPSNEAVIDIPVASDNISITLSAVVTEKPNLFVQTPNKTATSTATSDDVVSIGARINSSGKEVAFGSNMLATRYISAAVGDTFTVRSDLSYDTNNYTGMVAFYASDGTYISQILKQYNWIWSEDKKEGTITIPNSFGGHDLSACAKARFVIAYSDMNNIIINKN